MPGWNAAAPDSDMVYSYEAQKNALFTDKGSRMFTAARDKFLALLTPTGSGRAGQIFGCVDGSSDSWGSMAVLDRMVELGDIAYVPGTTGRKWQHQIVELVENGVDT